MELLGITIGVGVALALFLIGLIGLFGKGVLGGYAKGILSIIPVGNYKLWAILFIVLGLAAGGATYGWNTVKGATSGVTTASGVNTLQGQTAMSILQIKECTLATIGQDGTDMGGVSFRNDQSDIHHEYVDVDDTNQSAVINGTLTCVRDNTLDLSKGGSVKCNI